MCNSSYVRFKDKGRVLYALYISSKAATCTAQREDVFRTTWYRTLEVDVHCTGGTVREEVAHTRNCTSSHASIYY